MKFNQSIVLKALCYAKNNEYEKALTCYEQFASQNEEIAHTVSANMRYCEARIHGGYNTGLPVNALQQSTIGTGPLALTLSQLGVEQIYVVNLEKQRDRLIRFYREMNTHGLTVTYVPGVDGEASDEARENLQNFCCRSLAVSSSSTRHIPEEKKQYWKKELGLGIFGYLLSQKNIFEDAIKQGYKRILVFDDDVFFHSSAHNLLQKFLCNINNDFKLLLLGASEYFDRRSPAFMAYRRPNVYKSYHPIPGYTCGSFAVIYDKSIYNEVLCYILEMDGPFDNAALGAVYLNHRDKCFVADPAICIPDVANSSLRKRRDQLQQSAQMNWEIARYSEFTQCLSAAVIVAASSVGDAKVVAKKMTPGISLSIFRKTSRGVRPVEQSCNFFMSGSEMENFALNDPASFRECIAAIGVPPSDIVMAWPEGSPLTEDGLLSVFGAAMLARNQNGCREGIIEGVVYCVD